MTGQPLKEEGTYFKVRVIIHMKFKDLGVLFFQIPLNNGHFDTKFSIFQNC